MLNLKRYKTFNFQFMSVEQLIRNINTKILIKPECQRAIDRQQVGEIFNYQVKHYSKYGEFFFTSPITLAKLQDNYYIVDGQHRLACLEMINNSREYTNDFEIPVVILKIENMQELDDKYIAINQNRPVPLPKDIKDWKQFGGYVDTFLTNNYSCYFSKAERPKSSNFNKEKLLEYINKEEISKLVDFNHQKFIEEIKVLNIFYLQGHDFYLKPYFNTNLNKQISNAKEKQKENIFILGIFKNFEWVHRIVEKISKNIEYENMNHLPLNFREKIKKNTRRQVWNKYFTGSLIGNCFTCCNEIDYDSFECGHVKALFYGGLTNVSNMEPICGQCNREMGVKNLYEFKKELEAQNC